MTSSPPSGWRRQLAQRVRYRPGRKGVVITLSISIFMAVYFILLEHPRTTPRIVPLQALDRLIGFVPWAIVPYATLWVYISIVPTFLLRTEIPRYVASVLLLAVLGCGVFFFWPTMVPPAGIDWSHWPLIALIKSADAAGNACPSLHVGYAVLTVIWLDALLRNIRAPRTLRAMNGAWCVLIAWSTLATRQHVALDVETGALAGAATALVGLHAPAWFQRRRTGRACKTA